jgi:glutaredoxin
MFDTCPYCRRVLNYIEESGRTDIVLHNIRKNEEDQQRLIRDGGKEQVPCLFIDGKPLYESLDIIQWLQEHPAI